MGSLDLREGVFPPGLRGAGGDLREGVLQPGAEGGGTFLQSLQMDSSPEIEAALERLHGSLVSVRSELESEKIDKRELQVCKKPFHLVKIGHINKALRMYGTNTLCSAFYSYSSCP